MIVLQWTIPLERPHGTYSIWFTLVHMVRESLYTQIIVWVDTVLNHIDTRMILPEYDNSCMVYTPEWYPKPKYRHISIPY
jgi:hypothetical protein